MGNNTALATNTNVEPRTITDVVANKVKKFVANGDLFFPANYSPENALKSAWLQLQETVDRNSKPALEVCTKDSVANALLDMVVQGLNPAKKQCYFIVYGNKLVLQRSYFGTMHIAKSVEPEIEDIVAEVVYEGDDFAYRKERGRTVISKHEQTLDNIDKAKIKAAYCSVFYRNGKEVTTIMTLSEIKQAWAMSKTNPIDDKGNIKASSTHGKFTADMCKKTVTNRACKNIINSSNDSNLILNAYRNSDDQYAQAQVEQEIADNANKIPLTVDSDTGEVIDEQYNTIDDITEDDLP